MSKSLKLGDFALEKTLQVLVDIKGRIPKFGLRIKRIGNRKSGRDLPNFLRKAIPKDMLSYNPDDY